MDNLPGGTENTSGQSFMSLMNKLPTARLDAKFAAARETEIPQQGEQTGGYTISYAHLSHLPLFPLYSEKQTKIFAQAQKHKAIMVQAMDDADPDKKLNGAQKGFMSIMSTLSGGANPVSMKRWERRLLGLNVATADMHVKQRMMARFTRWSVPSNAGSFWFVDVLEFWHINPDSTIAKLAGNYTAVTLKAGLAQDGKVTLRLLGSDTAELKGQKMCSKKAKSASCEAITAVAEDGREVPMEIVARIQRACSSPELAELMKRFDKEWNVPIM